MEAISTFSNEVSYQIAVIIGSYLFLEAISCFWKENEVSLAKNVLLFTIGIIGCFLFYQALGSLLCLLLYAIIPSFSNGVSYHSAITTIRIIIIESSAVWFKEKRAQDTKTMAFIVTASLPMKVCASCSKKQMKDSFSKKNSGIWDFEGGAKNASKSKERCNFRILTYMRIKLDVVWIWLLCSTYPKNNEQCNE